MIDLFDEFFKIIREFNDTGIQYAVVGGIAMAFHDEPRYTKDIDFLILPEDMDAVNSALQKIGYFESSEPWTFTNTKLTMHRFMRTEGEEFLMVDILVGNEPEYREMISQVVLDRTDSGTVRLAGKGHLIRLKQVRNSDQDQVDIRRLRGDKD